MGERDELLGGGSRGTVTAAREHATLCPHTLDQFDFISASHSVHAMTQARDRILQFLSAQQFQLQALQLGNDTTGAAAQPALRPCLGKDFPAAGAGAQPSLSQHSLKLLTQNLTRHNLKGSVSRGSLEIHQDITPENPDAAQRSRCPPVRSAISAAVSFLCIA